MDDEPLSDFWTAPRHVQTWLAQKSESGIFRLTCLALSRSVGSIRIGTNCHSPFIRFLMRLRLKQGQQSLPHKTGYKSAQSVCTKAKVPVCKEDSHDVAMLACSLAQTFCKRSFSVSCLDYQVVPAHGHISTLFRAQTFQQGHV